MEIQPCSPKSIDPLLSTSVLDHIQVSLCWEAQACCISSRKRFQVSCPSQISAKLSAQMPEPESRAAHRHALLALTAAQAGAFLVLVREEGLIQGTIGLQDP